MKIRLVSVLLFMVLGGDLRSQEATQLKIGDPVPDLEISNLINNPVNDSKLSAFRGKLLILDFWATWCAPCIAAFPKMDSLKKKFGSSLEILPVTAEDKKVVLDFMERRKNVVRFASATTDKTLRLWFRHASLPHYVWIGPDGRLLAITEYKDVTEDNIRQVLEGKTVSLPLKQDEELRDIVVQTKDYELFGPGIMVKEGNKLKLGVVHPNEAPFHYSLTRYIKGSIPGYITNIDSTQFYIMNSTIRRLYKTAINGSGMEGMNASNTVIEIPDSAIYRQVTSTAHGMEYESWLQEHGYCFGMKVPPSLASQKNNIMLRALNSYFGPLLGIEGVIEMRNSKSLSLVRSNMDVDIKTKGGKPAIQPGKDGTTYTNVSISEFLGSLTVSMISFPPVTDETGFKEKVDLQLALSFKNLETINKELEKAGLQLVEKERMLPIGVIRLKK